MDYEGIEAELSFLKLVTLVKVNFCGIRKMLKDFTSEFM